MAAPEGRDAREPPAARERELFHSLETRALPVLGALMTLLAPGAFAAALWVDGRRTWAAAVGLAFAAAAAALARDVRRARWSPAGAAASALFAALVVGGCWRLL